MFMTDAFKNLLLAASDVDAISLHSGDPGTAGTANEISGSGYARPSVAFDAASGGVRPLSADEPVSGPASQSVTHLGFWAGSVFRCSEQLAAPVAFNSEGELLITTDTQLTLGPAS